MAEVKAGADESIDSLLKRFNRKVQQDGILSDVKRQEHYEKPSIRRKRQVNQRRHGGQGGLV